MIALPKLANRSAVTSPSNTGPACDGAPISATVAASSSATASQLTRPEPRRPAKAATIIRIVPPIDRISSGSKGGEAAHQCVAPWSMCIGALAERQVRIAGRRDALEPRQQAADVVADRPQEALRIDAHPEHREPRSARAATIRAPTRSGIAAASACALRAEADAPVEVEHVGGAEDDAGGRDDRRPARRLIGADQAQELADEAAGAGQADAGHGEDHEQQAHSRACCRQGRRSGRSRACAAGRRPRRRTGRARPRRGRG